MAPWVCYKRRGDWENASNVIGDLFNAINAIHEKMLKDVDRIEVLNDVHKVHVNQDQLHEGIHVLKANFWS